MAFSPARLYTRASSQYHEKTSPVGLISGTNAWYLFTWVYILSDLNMDLIGRWGNAGSRGWELYYDQNDNKLYFYTSTDGTDFPSVAWSSAASLNTFYFVEVFYDGTNIGICVNRGTDVTAAQAGGIFGTTASWRIGAVSSAGTTYANARIQGTGYISGMPSATDRNNIYNTGSGVLASNKPTLSSGTYISFLNGNEASGNLTDSVGSNTMTDNNGVTTADGIIVIPTSASSPTSTLGLSIRLGI